MIIGSIFFRKQPFAEIAFAEISENAMTAASWRAVLVVVVAIAHAATAFSVPAGSARPSVKTDARTATPSMLFPWEVPYAPSIVEQSARAPSVVPFLDDTAVILALVVIFPTVVTIFFLQGNDD